MMKKILRKLGAFFLSAAMLASLAVNAAAVDADANPPEEVWYAVSTNAYSGAIGLEFGEDYADWINAIIGVEVNGTKYNNGNDSFFPDISFDHGFNTQLHIVGCHFDLSCRCIN